MSKWIGRWVLRTAAGLALVVLATATAGCGGGDDDSGASPTAAATTAGVVGSDQPKSAFGKEVNGARIPEQLADGTRIGAADAKVTIEAYEDFGCPHCLEFNAAIEPLLMSEYIAPGKVAFVYRYFPLRQLTGVAAIGAQCAAEQGAFWPFHRKLFVAQAEANNQSGPALSDAFAPAGLQKFAADLGLDGAKFDTCLDSDEAVAAVTADLQKANELGLPGTPAFVINGKVTPTPASWAEWKKLLDGLLK